ncbi:hypothetical protein SDC9_84393 [bioreactor metagenome]|uniref:Uncharacterized protein n=1 Tax=bioreactor metagenome TaxID=1076179 RepID=A0A644ZJ28_9ZZZZ
MRGMVIAIIKNPMHIYGSSADGEKSVVTNSPSTKLLRALKTVAQPTASQPSTYLLKTMSLAV